MITKNDGLLSQLEEAKRIQELIRDKEKEIRELQHKLSYCLNFCIGYVQQSNKTINIIKKFKQETI